MNAAGILYRLASIFGWKLRYINIHDNLSFQAIIFCTSSGLSMAFIVDSDKVNKLVLSPILIWIIWQVYVGKWNLVFKIVFLRLWIYVLPLRMLATKWMDTKITDWATKPSQVPWNSNLPTWMWRINLQNHSWYSLLCVTKWQRNETRFLKNLQKREDQFETT